MIGRWYIKKVPLVLGLCMVVAVLALVIGRLAPARPQLYVLSGRSGMTLEIIAFDVDRNVSIRYAPQPPLHESAWTQWALSPDGKYFVFQNGLNLMRMDVSGSNQRWLTQDGTNNSPVWSPDGKHIAFISDRDNNTEIYVMDDDGNNQRRLTVNSRYDSSPVWSPDGNRIIFTSYLDGFPDLYIMNINGKNQKRLTVDMQAVLPTWSPDGQRIVFQIYQDGSKIYVMDADGNHQHQLTSSNQDVLPNLSLDGQQIIFLSSRESLTNQLYIMNADGSNQHLLIYMESAVAFPSWSQNGDYIMFLEQTNGIYQGYVVNRDGTNLRYVTSWASDQVSYGALLFIPDS